MSYPFFLHGSSDSLDIDAHFLIPEVLPRTEAKTLCDSIDNANANLIVVRDGVVTWCYKGPVDEVNNGLFTTYDLHVQKYPCPVTRLLPRNKAVKMVRVMRGVLGQFSRTTHRNDVKAALHSSSWSFKLHTLTNILHDSTLFTQLDSKTAVDTKKFLAFQIIQALALLEGEEIFTKHHASMFSPLLKPYLYREHTDGTGLMQYLHLFCQTMSWEMGQGDGTIMMCSDGSKADIKTELPI